MTHAGNNPLVCISFLIVSADRPILLPIIGFNNWSSDKTVTKQPNSVKGFDLISLD